MRVAFFTPLAPVRSGISAYSAELLPTLAAAHEVDAFVEDDVWVQASRHADGRPPILTRSGPVDLRRASDRPDAGDEAGDEAGDGAANAGNATTDDAVANAAGGAAVDGGGSAAPGRVRLWRAHDFQPRHLLAPYDLIVYQLGNATCHEFMWPYLFRYPGLVVLHDGQLHHARAHALLRRGRKADYRAELRDAHPDAPPDAAEFVIAGFQGPLYYVWPLVSAVVRRARLVAVHNPRLAGELREAFPDAAIETIRMGVRDVRATAGVQDAALTAELTTGRADTAAHVRTGAGHDVTPSARTPHGALPGGPLFAAFGLITPEKRIPQLLRALAAIVKVAPGARLRLVGDTAPHYDARAEAEALGIADRVEITGYVPDDELDAQLADADVCVCLRWPTARETSASWLRCLAARRPTIVNDLTHLVDVPTLDPRSWIVLHAREDAEAVARAPRPADAVAVSIDILDEDHSLELAMRRLATDAELRRGLGLAARRYWESAHTLALMTADYERLMALAAARPAPDPGAIGLPSHLLEDHTGLAREIAAPFGVSVD